MDLLRPLRAFDQVQPANGWFAIPVAVLKKFGDDQAGGLAALIAYYAFLCLFPLLLVFVTILGFVLHGDVSAQEAVEKSVLGQFPVIGHDLRTRALHGHVLTIIFGVLVSLWAGLGVTQAGQNAFNKLWAVPLRERPDTFHTRVRGLALLFLLGILFLASSLASGLAAGGLGTTALEGFGFVLSLLLNVMIFGVVFRFLTAASVPTRCLWIGVLVGAVTWELLQVLGGYYVAHVVRNASGTYGLFALVIGLLAWLHLGAQATLFAAELNVVLARHLWPRRLFGSDLPGDEATLRALAKIEERTADQRIEVHFRH